MDRNMKKGTLSFFRQLIFRAGTGRMFFVATVLFAVVGTSPVFAQGLSITDTPSAVGALCTVLNLVFSILIAVSVIMVLWAAYLYVTAGDNMEQVTEAKRALFYAAMGIIAALFAKGFPTFVGAIFGISIHACEVVSHSFPPGALRN